MIQGTASHVGKSVLTAGFCRLFARRGLSVAPFKAQNMALNSYVTLDGGEIGRSTAFAARAAGIEPTIEMNPVLLKPSSETGCQVVLLGKPVRAMDTPEYYQYQRTVLPVIESSLLLLRQLFDIVVMEGAGCPAEINLMDRDIANMKAAAIADAPVLLVGDIERGGVFASLYGTLALLPPDDRWRIKGLVINKFRGDPSLLSSGLAFLERECGVPVLGVLPYLRDLVVEEEDSVSLDESVCDERASDTQASISVIKLPHISNFTDFDPLRREPGMHIRYVGSVKNWGSPDLVILPGTKSTMHDLDWMRQTGLADRLMRFAGSGGKVLGICGGFQMLGRTIEDVCGIESRSTTVAGLGLLDVETRFVPQKTLRRVSACGCNGWIAGARFAGYEVHQGIAFAGRVLPFAAIEDGALDGMLDGAVGDTGLVAGTYVHGLFDSPQTRAALRRWLGVPERRVDVSSNEPESVFDRLADCLEQNLDIGRVLDMIGPIGRR